MTGWLWSQVELFKVLKVKLSVPNCVVYKANADWRRITGSQVPANMLQQKSTALQVSVPCLLEHGVLRPLLIFHVAQAADQISLMLTR